MTLTELPFNLAQSGRIGNHRIPKLPPLLLVGTPPCSPHQFPTSTWISPEVLNRRQVSTNLEFNELLHWLRITTIASLHVFSRAVVEALCDRAVEDVERQVDLVAW